jgi:quercetin dioxygenase-like cupin family protein
MEVHMKTTRIITLSVLAASSLGLHSTSAQQQGVTRTELQRHDLSAPGREVIQVQVDLDPGVMFPMHSHPGEEIIYVLEGEWEYQVEGKGTLTLKTGEVLFIPAGVKHAAKNVGSGKGSELATYIVEKGKPLVVLAK